MECDLILPLSLENAVYHADRPLTEESQEQDKYKNLGLRHP